MLDFNTFSRDESAFEGKQGDVWFFFFLTDFAGRICDPRRFHIQDN